MLAHLTGTPEVSMMLVAPKLRVIHVTTHMGLLDAIDRIEPGLVERTIARGHDTLVRARNSSAPYRRLRDQPPCRGKRSVWARRRGTENHASHHRLLGKRLADRRSIARRYAVFRAGRGDFDLVVAMYHDQGHGPIKVLGMKPASCTVRPTG